MSRRIRLPSSADRSSQSSRETLAQARAAALGLLAAHKPADEKEARDIRRIQSLIAAQANIFSRNRELGHVTASAVIVELESCRTLLHHHKHLGRWLQVGGHLEDDSDIAQAALREAREETGLPDLRFHPAIDAVAPIDVDVHAIPQSGDQPEHLHLDFRYVLVTSQPCALSPATGESTQFRWLSFAEALAMGDEIDAALRRLLRKARDLFCDGANSLR